MFNTIIKILNDIELTTFPCDPRQKLFKIMLNKSLGMILYPAQFLSFPGFSRDKFRIPGFSRTKIKIQGFPGAVRTLQIALSKLQPTQTNCKLEIHKRFVNKASDWIIRKREANQIV